MGMLCSYTNPNNFKAQLDYIFLNKKSINSAFNCESYLKKKLLIIESSQQTFARIYA